MSERASLVRPPYGPTLIELIRPRGRRPLLAVAMVLIGIVIWLAAGGASNEPSHVVVHGAIPFNLDYPDGLRRVDVRPGELLRLQTTDDRDPQSLAVRPLHLDAYRGDVNAQLALLTSTLIPEMRRSIPGFIWRGDGRVVVNKQPGYMISFQALIDGRTTYGKRVLLVPTASPPPRAGVDITMLSARSQAIYNVDAVGSNGQLKSPYRTFVFGTESLH